MLKLERLEISGFKSFADRTVVDFGEGITGVVGPNGCGKSNIAEAISWVLGEQSAKTLRGSKMEDVIFNGTRDRKPTGLAEVTLRLIATADIASRDSEESSNEDEAKFDRAVENADRAASAAEEIVKQAEQPDGPPVPPNAAASDAVQQSSPEGAVTESTDSVRQVDQGQQEEPDQAAVAEDHKHAAKKHAYRPRKRPKIILSAGERITIGRRLYRTGESDYLINNRLCLLRDIQDLFAGTGLGGAHYAIIEQGKIGQILSSKPLDRRGLIEEAAGITKFKTRKRLAELKLESARQNLTRLNDIISEVERQVNSLKRQAAKARRYRRLRDEMRSLLRLIFTADYYHLTKSAGEIAARLAQAQSLIAELDGSVAERENEHRAVSTEARAAEDNLSLLKEQASTTDLDLDRVRNRRKFEEQQLGELTARVEEDGRAQQSLTDRLALLDSEIERKSGALGVLQTEVNQEQTELLAREKRYQAELSRLREAESNIEKLRQQLFVESGKAERLHSNLGSLQDALRRIDNRRTGLDAELERASARSSEVTANRAEIQEKLTAGQEQLSHLTVRTAEAELRLEAAKEEVALLRPQLESVQADRSASERTLLSLQEVDARHAYFSDAVQQVLAPEHAAKLNALGTLADFVQADPQYERLIESLFGRELQSILVPTIDDALAGVDYLKDEGLGRGAFLVVGLHGAEGDSPDSAGYYLENSEGQRELSSAGQEPNLAAEIPASNEMLRGSPRENRLEATSEPLRAIDSAKAGDEPSFLMESPEAQAEVNSNQENSALIPAPAVPPGYEPPELREIQEIDPDQLEDQPEANPAAEPISDTISSEDSGEEMDTRADEIRAEIQPDTGLRFQLDALRAIDLMGLRAEIKSITERAFPDKCSALVVPDIEAALHLSMENGWRTYVTYDGEQVVNGRLIVSSAQAGKQGTSLLALRREIRELKERTDVLAADDERLSAALTVARAELQQAETETTALHGETRKVEKSVGSLQSEFDSLGRELERAEQHVAVIQSELEQTGEERQELLGRISEAEASLLAAEGARNLAQHTLKIAQDEFAVMRSVTEQMSEQVSGARASAAARVERLRAAQSEIKRLETEAEDLNSRINRIRVEIYESQTRAEQLRVSYEEGSTELARLESESVRLATEVAVALEHLTAVRARADELEAQLSSMRASVAAAREERSQIEIEHARLQSEADHLARMCVTELATPLQEVVSSVEAEVAARTVPSQEASSEEAASG
ncbi:MAG TPA: AAA family ATPase, partial [Blastocatellia bacterium]|nr:AAA family ATPase [Blastocatellia bacterium]